MSTETNSPPALSERELQVLRLVATGATNNQIARDLQISVNTVKVHLNNIFSKLGVQSRTEAALFAVRHGWVELRQPGAVSVVDTLAPGAAPPLADLPAGVAQSSGPAASIRVNSAPAVVVARRPTRFRYALIGALVVAVLLGLFAYPLASSTETWRSYLGPRTVSPPAPNPPPRWALKTALPVAREAMAVAVVDGVIYAVGGAGEQSALDDLSVYDPGKDTWAAGARKPTAALGIGAAVLGGRIYVPGGCDAQNHPSNVLEVYDPARGRWDPSVSLPRAICRYALSTVEGRLYLFGGWDGNETLADVLVFDPARGEWSTLPPLPSPRADAAAAVINDRIYVVGGRTGEKVLNEVLAFEPSRVAQSSSPWSTKAPLLHARAQLGLAPLAGNLYALGGGWSIALAENERYDSQADHWSPIESSPEPVERAGGAAALDTKVYLLGGWHGRALASVQEYTALYRFFVPSLPGQQ